MEVTLKPVSKYYFPSSYQALFFYECCKTFIFSTVNLSTWCSH